MKVHVIDGTYELYRAHFSNPPSQAPNGRPVGAVKGLIRSMLNLLRQSDVTHVACAFDHVVESFRNDLFDGYKDGREVPEDLKSQFGLAEQAVAALGIVVWPMNEYEADDALATAAARWGVHPQVDQVVICSPDKDLAQMVQGQQVVCLDRRQAILYDDAGVVEKFGIKPASIPDYLGLMGDSADRFPGIPRWGAKTSSQILAEYNHIENIPLDSTEWSVKVRGADAVATSLKKNYDKALFYRELATLRTDVMLAETLEQLTWQGVHQGRFYALCNEHGFSSEIIRQQEWNERT
jgi:5'-3' exonuclease